MSTGLQPDNPTIVSAFRSLLFREALIVLVICALLAVAWNVLREAQLRKVAAGTASPELWAHPEPIARRVLRIGFGLIWILDGFLQGQASMPLGMTTQVIGPAAAPSPAWVQHLANFGATIWSYHPITAPASAVWIQVGLGVWLLMARRGKWSQLAGLSSAAWGLVVWVFGEAFGGIFAPGLSWAFGAPGAALFYCFAGGLIALPDRRWLAPRLGRAVLAVMGLFFVGMAVLQAWPGRGFWRGQPRPGQAPGTLTAMVQQMAQTPQPHLLAGWVAEFAAFDAAHGWAVNLFLVVSLASIGMAFLSGRTAVIGPAVVAGVVLCLTDWVLIEDLGFLGGVGTDPNSMIPMALLFLAGYLALTRVPLVTELPVPIAVARPARLSLWERSTARPRHTLQGLAAAGALAITLVGAAPMAVALVNPNADPILAEAVDGTPDAVHLPAPSFQLTDQSGTTVSLQDLRGRVIAVTFLDPVCISDCPIIAQEFREADRMLGAGARRVELVGVVANPVYRSLAYVNAFDRQEGLEHVPNWLYLTGSSGALNRVWNSFGVQVEYAPGGAMIAHSDVAYVIDQAGDTRYVLDMDPGPATETTQSSSAVVLANTIDRVLGS
ncbi:MAG TPA: SCO family protein [Acidimicrobiales bacterium]|nr:SCO family protein [Acidimicrobiales bacterium]